MLRTRPFQTLSDVAHLLKDWAGEIPRVFQQKLSVSPTKKKALTQVFPNQAILVDSTGTSVVVMLVPATADNMGSLVVVADAGSGTTTLKVSDASATLEGGTSLVVPDRVIMMSYGIAGWWRICSG